MKTKTYHILIFLFLASVFLLAFNKIYDPDAWAYLSHGRLIWEMKWLPENEVFLYPAKNMPYFPDTWLFAIISYTSYLLFDIYGLILFKALTVTVAFSILLKDSLRPHQNYSLALLILTAAVTLSQYRFVLRPDIALMVFLSFSIFCLNAYLYDNKKYIYSLPIIHMIWANSHSSINVMFIPFVAFITGGLIQRQLAKRGIGSKDAPSPSQLKTITAVFFGSFTATLINPRFISHYLTSYDILALEWSRQEIIELQPPSGRVLSLLIALVIIIAFSFFLNRRRFSTIHFFVVLPFIAPAFIVRRLILLVIIVGTPIVIRNISEFLKSRNLDGFFRRRTLEVFTAIWIVLYCLLSLAKVSPFGVKHTKFGFGFDYFMVPKGAVEYMDENDIQGRMMNTFHFGHYLIWTGHPKRQVFIDGRGNLTEDLLDKSNTFRYVKSILNELYETYGFESVIMTYPKRLGDIDLALTPPEWALVYWDDMSLLYLKRGVRYDSIIEKDEYHSAIPYLSIESFVKTIGNRDNQRNIEIELKRNYDETGSSKAITLLGLLYRSTGRYKEAVDLLSGSPKSYTDHVVLGDSYRKLSDIEKSLYHYRKAEEIDENAGLMYMIGAAYLDKGETEQALNYLKRAVDKKKDMVYVYPLLVNIYERLGKTEDAKRFKEEYQKQMVLKSASRYFERGEKAYHEKRYADALEEFNNALKITPSDPVIFTDMGFVYYDMGQIQMAHEHFIRALDLAPSPSDATHGLRLPNAHYGLGLVYGKLGNREEAIRHFKKYIKTGSSGYYTRSAKRMIRELSR